MEAYALTEEMEDLRTEKNHTLASLGTADNKVMAKICRRTKQQKIIIRTSDVQES